MALGALVTSAPHVASAKPGFRVQVSSRALRARLANDSEMTLVRRSDPAEMTLTESIRTVPPAALAPPDVAALAPPDVVRWVGPKGHPLASVPWSACPRAAVPAAPFPPGFRALLRAGRFPLLAVSEVDGRPVVLWTAPLDARVNRDLAAWPLLNYVLHGAVLHAGGRPVPPLAEWDAAPLPGPRTAFAVGTFLALAWPLVLLAFLRARRRPVPPPDVLARYAAPGRTRRGGNPNPGWDEPSFARPLGGFFLFLAGSVFLLAPYFWLTGVLVPNHVQPFPQADGIWESIAELFLLVFFLFDFATNTAFVRFFAATRVQDPAKALRYAQLFLWWQVLSGLAQVTGVVLFVFSGLFTRSEYAFYGFFLLVHGVVQFPGFFGVAFHLLQGAQRFDYASGVDILEKRVFKVLMPIPFVLVFRAWGRANPAYGEAFGAVLGLGVGAYATQWTNFALGMFLCRRAGLPIRPLFGASFGTAEVRDVVTFGWKAILGQVAFRAANSVEIVVLVRMLESYTERLGIWSLLQTRFSYLVLLAYAFFDSGVAVFGEAIGAGKRAFAQYQLARFLQFAFLWGAVVFAILASLGPTFVQGALDPQWHAAAAFVGLAAFARALACPGWVSDALQRGANRPLLFSGVLAGEQALRLGLFLVLVPRYQLTGLFAAAALSLSVKTVVAWWLNHRYVLPLRLSVWQSVGAPVATGAVLYTLLTALVSIASPASSFAAQAVFYGGALGAILAALLVLALLGGLDAEGLSEIDRATRMTSILAPVARVFSVLARVGARLSPLHGRFPQPTAEAARREAAELRSPQ